MCEHEESIRFDGNIFCSDCGESTGAPYKVEDFIHDNPLDSDYMNKGTYKLTFNVNAESLDQAIDILDKISFEEKLKYIEKK